MSTPASILILGAGELGTAVLRGLAAYTETQAPTTTLTVLIRPATLATPSPAQSANLASIRALGAALAPGDLSASADELAAVFRGHDAVIGCTGFAASAGMQLRIARAALAAGVKRYIPWQFGVDYDVLGRGSAQTLFDEQLEVRKLLRSEAERQGMEWIIVSTGMFMSFVFEESFGVVEGVMTDGAEKTQDQPVVRALGGWDNSVTVTAVEDIGVLTAHVLFAPEVRNQVVFVAGETIAYERLADVVEKISRRAVRRELMTVDHLEKMLAEDPENGLVMYRTVFAGGVGVAWDEEKTFNRQRGLGTTDVETWLKKALGRD